MGPWLLLPQLHGHHACGKIGFRLVVPRENCFKINFRVILKISFRST
eukprot:SAG31_NODE_4471_length_3205_cov_2.753059_4_plen_46_part_01